MKKIVTILSLFAYCISGFAQDGGGNDKSFRFGLKVEPSFNWIKPDDKKHFAYDGLKMGMAIGAITDFKLGGNIWLSTGVAMDFNGAKLKYNSKDNNVTDTIGYYYSNDQGIVDVNTANTSLDNYISGTDTTTFPSYSAIQLKERTYNVNYLNIPLFIKMKTNEIGYMTYFGQFGLNTSIRTKARANDKANVLVGQGLSSDYSKDLHVDKEVQIAKMAGTIGGGFEYNISGSTSLVVSLNYDYGFTSLTKNTSKLTINYSKGLDSKGHLQAVTPQKNIQHAVRLTIGILF